MGYVYFRALLTIQLMLLTIIFSALGLSADTFAASVSAGMISRQRKVMHTLRIAITMAVFQASMPLIGWNLSYEISDYVGRWDHWIAFGLLLFLGGRMIYECFANGSEVCLNLSSFKMLILIALGTSIDALAAGVGFGFTKLPMMTTIVAIGIATFLASVVGLQFGHILGKRFGKWVLVAGGLILIGIGTSILLSHTGIMG